MRRQEDGEGRNDGVDLVTGRSVIVNIHVDYFDCILITDSDGVDVVGLVNQEDIESGRHLNVCRCDGLLARQDPRGCSTLQIQREKGLIAPCVNQRLKIKQESSGRPDWVGNVAGSECFSLFNCSFKSISHFLFLRDLFS